MTGNQLLLYFFGISACLLASTVAREAIIYGIPTPISYQVSVQLKDHGHVCGGGIIGDRFILTAAHCVLNHTRHLRNSKIFVVAGTHNLNRTGPPAVTIRVGKVFFPREFHPMTVFSLGDIAVLKLVNSLQVEDKATIEMLIFPRNYDHEVGDLFAGFGWNEYHNGIGHSDGLLRSIVMDTIFSNEECKRSFPREAIYTDIHFCGKTWHDRPNVPTDSTSGVCTGDDGGPLIGFDGKTIIGILSRVPFHCDEQREPAIFMRVAHYVGMIFNVMELNHDPRMISLRTSLKP